MPWLLGIVLLLHGCLVVAAPPNPDEFLTRLGMPQPQIGELAQGGPVAYALPEGSADELAAGVAVYLPVAAADVADILRHGELSVLDVDVAAYGTWTGHGGANQLAHLVLSEEDAQNLLDATPGDGFNLSAEEIKRLQVLKETLRRTPARPVAEAVSQHYRDILSQRFAAYRHGGLAAIGSYAREDSLDSSPALELRQAARADTVLEHYLPALHHAWLHYPAPLPPGADEAFLWVVKTVENRPAAILRHRVTLDWNGGVLVLTREFYAAHSYNSSQWITGCLPWHNGTLVFQQVRSYTDQVAGIASGAKHLVGRELLKEKMAASLERLRKLVDGKKTGMARAAFIAQGPTTP